VRFGAVDVPYVALIGAVEVRLASAESAVRSSVLAAAPAATELLPALGGSPRAAWSDCCRSSIG
jgi:hypothetical protein